MATKKTTKATAKAYSGEKEIRDAFKLYSSKPKERRSIMKRIIASPSKAIDKVFKRIPCNWDELITDSIERITKRNKGHKNAIKTSYVLKS